MPSEQPLSLLNRFQTHPTTSEFLFRRYRNPTMKTSMILYNLFVVLAVLVGRNLVASQEAATEEAAPETAAEPVQSGPLIDLLGTKLQSLEIIDQTSAQVKEHYTNEALAGKKVIGLYFSADWYVTAMLHHSCFNNGHFTFFK